MRRPLPIVVCLALAACGETEQAPATRADSVATAPAADSATVKACDLLSEAELEPILGVDLAPGRTTNDYAGDSQCRWDLPGDAQRGVSVSLRENGNFVLYSEVPGARPVSGFPGAAVWNEAVGQLAVQKGTRIVSVGLLLDDPQRSQAEAIARIALEKI